ncbi:MAG: L,D-transpeptidase family protein [Rhizobiales bacterium]|nr:L,D-transpeptidase family protein [Hyphomicrobiales bacterium]
MRYNNKIAIKVLLIIFAALFNATAFAAQNTTLTPKVEDAKNNTSNPSAIVEPSKSTKVPTALEIIINQQKAFVAYADFPKIAFNPTKPVKNPLTVYKLKNIVHTLPILDGLTRLHLQTLSKKKSVIAGLNIWKKERKMLKRKLILNNYKSLWFENNILNSAKANEILNTINNAEAFALRPVLYKASNIQSLIEISKTKIKPEWLKIPNSSQILNEMRLDDALNQLALNNAKLELALTHASFAYSRHASSGQIIPSSVDVNNNVHPVPTSTTAILKNIEALNKPGELQNWLELQNPQDSQFKALLAEYKIQSTKDQEYVKPVIISKGKTLKPGTKSKRIIKLAMRLEQLGFYSKTADTKYPNQYNKYIIAGVKDYQTSKGLKADGIVGSITIRSLNYKKPNRIKALLVNLERQRWMPKKMGYKHVLVNLAEFRLRIVEGGDVTHTARVVIGRNKFQTPIFHNKIRTVVVNPYWNIPNSIIYNEMRKKINSDPSYLARNNYETIGNISWEKATKRYVPFRIRQKPGPRNALGRVKFLFPNRHAIYLHDTPSKSLFSRSSRAFSHGCVRVQNPELLALNLMGWSKKRFNSIVKSGRNSHFAIKKKIPVYLTYVTAGVDKKGKMQYFRDVYKRDNAVANAIGVKQIMQQIASRNKAVNEKSTTQINSIIATEKTKNTL